MKKEVRHPVKSFLNLNDLKTQTPKKLSHKLKEYYLNNKNSIISLIILILAILFLFYIYTPVDCGNDSKCFDKYVSSCTRSKLLSSSQENIFSYEIKGSLGKDCIINIKLEKTNPDVALNIKEKLEGKNMVCKLPKLGLTYSKIEDTKGILDSCSGSLKEGMLELIIEKMYSVIIQNIGKVTTELEKTLKPISI